jgi:hypothetical protein
VSAEDALSRAEKLLEKVEEARLELEQAEDSAQAIEILSRLSELAREVEAELNRARREAEVEDEDA